MQFDPIYLCPPPWLPILEKYALFSQTVFAPTAFSSWGSKCLFVRVGQNDNRWGRGSGLVVSVVALYSVDPGSNPAIVQNFSCLKLLVNKQKIGWVKSNLKMWAFCYMLLILHAWKFSLQAYSWFDISTVWLDEDSNWRFRGGGLMVTSRNKLLRVFR